MRHVVMDVLSPWVEIECPSCGLELDEAPEDVYTGMSCYCGYRLSKSDLSDRATLYAPDYEER